MTAELLTGPGSLRHWVTSGDPNDPIYIVTKDGLPIAAIQTYHEDTALVAGVSLFLGCTADTAEDVIEASPSEEWAAGYAEAHPHHLIQTNQGE